MKLVKRILELVLVILIITLFMMNKDVQMSINLFGITEEPLRVSFWALVTVCIAVGILIAAIGDFVTQMQWRRERKRMIKTDQEHSKVVKDLEAKVDALVAENERLTKELEAGKSQTTASIISGDISGSPGYTPPRPEFGMEDETDLGDEPDEEQREGSSDYEMEKKEEEAKS
jgi:uncharacterized integral membrane protein